MFISFLLIRKNDNSDCHLLVHPTNTTHTFSSLCDSELKQHYKITAVPKLVIVKENGQVITDKGRKQIRDKGLACFRTWLEAAEIFQNFNSF